MFTTMAAEEEKHIETLSRLFTNIVKTERPAFSIPKINPARIADADAVLTEQIKREVEAASYETAAIYATRGDGGKSGLLLVGTGEECRREGEGTVHLARRLGADPPRFPHGAEQGPPPAGLARSTLLAVLWIVSLTASCPTNVLCSG